MSSIGEGMMTGRTGGRCLYCRGGIREKRNPERCWGCGAPFLAEGAYPYRSTGYAASQLQRMQGMANAGGFGGYSLSELQGYQNQLEREIFQDIMMRPWTVYGGTPR